MTARGTMPTVVLRTDGSLATGLGHVSRCLTLAEELRGRGLDVVVACAAGESAVTGLIERAGFRVADVVTGEWRGDGETTRAVVEGSGARIVVTDLGTDRTAEAPAAYVDYLAALRALGVAVLTFDDLNVLDFPSDVVVNPNVGAEHVAYPAHRDTQYLLGLPYFPCRRALAAAGRARRVQADGRRVVVTLGGADEAGTAVAVARGLARLPAVEVVVLAGMETRWRAPLSKIAAESGGRVRIVDGVADVPPWFAWADVAVTGGGLTKYETSAAGLPTVLVAQVPHQARLAERFAREGSAVSLGTVADATESRVAETVGVLLSDPARREAMSAAGRRLVDGGGAARIAGALLATAEAAAS